MTELMDSGGGLITSARSLGKFIGSYNVAVGDAGAARGRVETARAGGMAGTTSWAECFNEKSKKYDFAFIFNQRDKGQKPGQTTSLNLGNFIWSMKEKIKARY